MHGQGHHCTFPSQKGGISTAKYKTLWLLQDRSFMGEKIDKYYYYIIYIPVMDINILLSPFWA